MPTDTVIVDRWELPAERSALRTTHMLRSHGVALRADEGLVLCIRRSCNHLISSGRVVEYLDRQHPGWARGLDRRPTNADFCRELEAARHSFEGEAPMLHEGAAAPAHLTPPARGALMRLEEGLPVVRVWWCVMCDKGYTTVGSFLHHFTDQRHVAEYGAVDRQQRLRHGEQTAAQQWSQMPGHFLFKVLSYHTIILFKNSWVLSLCHLRLT